MKSKVHWRSRILFFLFSAIVIINPSGANASFEELDNGYLDTNIKLSIIHFQEDGDDIYYYRTPFSSGSKIYMTNYSGIGITMVSNNECFTTDIYDGCGAYDNNVSVISSSDDYSGVNQFTVADNNYTYGTVTSTREVVVGGNSFKLINNYTLSKDKAYLLISTSIQNANPFSATLDLFLNNFDGMVEHDWEYTRTRGNLSGNEFTQITETTKSSNAVLADASAYGHIGKDYGSILYTSASGTSTYLNSGCCDPAALALFGGVNSDISASNQDGSYSIKLPLDLNPNETVVVNWAFAAGTFAGGALNASLLSEIQSVVAPTEFIVGTSLTRKTRNLTFSQSTSGSDTLADPTGELRALIDLINRMYSN